MKRIAMLAAGLALATIAGSGLAQEQRELKVSLFTPPGTIVNLCSCRWRRRSNRRPRAA